MSLAICDVVSVTGCGRSEEVKSRTSETSSSMPPSLIATWHSRFSEWLVVVKKTVPYCDSGMNLSGAGPSRLPSALSTSKSHGFVRSDNQCLTLSSFGAIPTLSAMSAYDDRTVSALVALTKKMPQKLRYKGQRDAESGVRLPHLDLLSCANLQQN